MNARVHFHLLCVCRSKKLFEIWNKYKVRLPSYYYEKQLLQIADFLSEIKVGINC